MLRNQALNQKLDYYYTIRGETDFLPKAFAVRLSEKIHCGAPVVRIEQSAQGVKAVFLRAGAYHTLTGDHLICAVPFTVQKNIEVTPAFSVEKQRAIEQLPYLSASKIFLQAKERFWVKAGQSGFDTTDLPISQVWDMTYGQPGTRGILQAYPISLHSRRVTAMSEKERIDFALEQVEMVYPGIRKHFEGGAAGPVARAWISGRSLCNAVAFMNRSATGKSAFLIVVGQAHWSRLFFRRWNCAYPRPVARPSEWLAGSLPSQFTVVDH